jgi:hypothetical protein
MPISRSRSFDARGLVQGHYVTFPPFASDTIQSATAGDYGTCDDQVCAYREKRLPQTLLIVRKSTRLPIFNGTKYVSGSPVKQFINCPADYHPTEPSPGTKFPPLSVAQESQLAWESLAATNPNVPDVNLPSFWAELKDLPSLLKDWGDNWLSKPRWDAFLATNINRFRNTLSDVARAHLMYRWAIRPMLSDLWKLFQWQTSVAKRMEWLVDLTTGRRVLRQRATIRSNTDQDSPTTVALKSAGASINGRRYVTYQEKIWCVVNWKLDTSKIDLSRVLPPNFLIMDKDWVRVHQLSYGITTYGALRALWEIMPWSWFADWFLHVSTVMDATDNTIPVTHGDIILMRTTSAKANVEPITTSPDSSWVQISGPHRQSEVWKQRLIVSPILPFAPSMLPVFTTGQWSILSSLGVLRSGAHVGSKIR